MLWNVCLCLVVVNDVCLQHTWQKEIVKFLKQCVCVCVSLKKVRFCSYPCKLNSLFLKLAIQCTCSFADLERPCLKKT